MNLWVELNKDVCGPGLWETPMGVFHHPLIFLWSIMKMIAGCSHSIDAVTEWRIRAVLKTTCWWLEPGLQMWSWTENRLSALTAANTIVLIGRIAAAAQTHVNDFFVVDFGDSAEPHEEPVSSSFRPPDTNFKVLRLSGPGSFESVPAFV